MMKRSMAAASLVLDFNLYPRQRVDETNIRRLDKAFELGEPLPADVADKASLRVVDGFHRIHMVLRRDPNGMIDVELRDYPDDAAILLDAVRRNARHGVSLTSYDHARVVALSDTLKLDRALVAEALAIPIAALDKIRDSRTAYKSDGDPVQIKRSFKRLKGQKLTDTQVRANERASGWSAAFHADQLLNLIEASAIDWDDEPTRAVLTKLGAVLSDRLIPA